LIALGIVIATAAAFAVSGVYYGIAPSSQTRPVPQRAIGAQVLVELVRNLAVAALVAGLLVAADWSGVVDGALVGLSLSILPVVLLAGSVFHEGVPMRHAALHAGDWLLKLVATGSIVGIFT
jgi:uncharacterized protein DUF1761